MPWVASTLTKWWNFLNQVICWNLAKQICVYTLFLSFSTRTRQSSRNCSSASSILAEQTLIYKQHTWQNGSYSSPYITNICCCDELPALITRKLLNIGCWGAIMKEHWTLIYLIRWKSTVSRISSVRQFRDVMVIFKVVLQSVNVFTQNLKGKMIQLCKNKNIKNDEIKQNFYGSVKPPYG